MHYINVLLITAGILEFALGFAILLRNNKSQTNLAFTSFSFSLAAWALGIAFFRMSTDPGMALFWSKVYYIAGATIAASLLYFAHVFPEEKYLTTRRKLLIIIPTVIHIFLLGIPQYLTRGIVIQDSGNEVILGNWEYFIYSFYFLPVLYGALYILWSKYKIYSGIIKRQIMLVLVSTFFTSIFGVIFDLILPWLGNYRLIYIGPPFTMVIFSALSYAILRQKLWDFKLVFARVVVYSLLLSVIAGAYSLSLYVVFSLFLDTITQQEILLLGGLFTFVIALTFQPLKRVVEERTDKVFFHKDYDSATLLSTLGYIMSTNIDLYFLTNKIMETLLKEIKITRGAFILLENNSIYDVVSQGFDEKPNYTYNQLLLLIERNQIIVFDELKEEGQMKLLMRQLNIAISQRLDGSDGMVGLLVLGEKASGEIYSDEDFRLIKILAPEIALAIQNAKSYDKIKKFNVTLSEEVKKATTQLQDANERLKVIDKLKDDFVSIASHELRTPMTAIRSYAWMVLNRSDVPLSQNLEKYVTRILISTERLINLVNDMLNVSRIESGRIEINPEPVDVISLAKDIVDEVYFSKSAEKKINFIVLEKPMPKVLADPEKLRQVFLNLVGNSLKFTPDGGKITFDFFTDGQVVEISVSDSGVGISKEDLSKLFHKFSRLDNSYTAAATSGGTGLGLFISKNLVELMHGKIRASSEGLGQGSTFAVSLPVASAETLKDIEKFKVKPKGEVKGLEPVAIHTNAS